MDVLKLCVQFSNREVSALCANLEQVRDAIDDFSTDHCEGDCQLYMYLDGAKKYVPVTIWCE